MLSKGHVVYEGISGHILTYDRECNVTDVFFFFSFSMKVLANGISIFSVFVTCRFVFSDS